MAIDDYIPKEDVLEAIDKLHTIRKEHELDTDSLGHKMWTMTNYASGYMMTTLGITYEELDAYRNRDSTQLELDLSYDKQMELTWDKK